MTQPLNQRRTLKAARPVDRSSGEFWLENPWKVGDHNLSAFERNRVLINSGGHRYFDVSHASTADLVSDSRAVVAGDFDGDGMTDLMVRSSGGGGLQVFRNAWPATRWLKVSLRGVDSNTFGLGAKLKFEIAGRIIWREVYVAASFMSQTSPLTHVNVGDAVKIDSLSVFWPAGTVQTFTDVDPNQHIEIVENMDSFRGFQAK